MVDKIDVSAEVVDIDSNTDTMKYIITLLEEIRDNTKIN